MTSIISAPQSVSANKVPTVSVNDVESGAVELRPGMILEDPDFADRVKNDPCAFRPLKQSDVNAASVKTSGTVEIPFNLNATYDYEKLAQVAAETRKDNPNAGED